MNSVCYIDTITLKPCSKTMTSQHYSKYLATYAKSLNFLEPMLQDNLILKYFLVLMLEGVIL